MFIEFLLVDGSWFIILQDNLCGFSFCNKGRQALAVSCKKNDKYRPFQKFHHDGEGIGRGKYLMHYEILYSTKIHCIAVLGIYDPQFFL